MLIPAPLTVMKYAKLNNKIILEDQRVIILNYITFNSNVITCQCPSTIQVICDRFY